MTFIRVMIAQRCTPAGKANAKVEVPFHASINRAGSSTDASQSGYGMEGTMLTTALMFQLAGSHPSGYSRTVFTALCSQEGFGEPFPVETCSDA